MMDIYLLDTTVEKKPGRLGVAKSKKLKQVSLTVSTLNVNGLFSFRERNLVMIPYIT